MHFLRRINLRKFMVEIVFLIAIVGMLGVMGISSKVYATVEYWTLNIGEEQIAVVGSEASANAVIEKLEQKYQKDGASDVVVSIDPIITIEQKSYLVSEEAPYISSVDEVVEEILTGNDGTPMVDITVSQTYTATETIKYETTTEETDEYEVGYEEVTQEGIDGKQEVTKRVTSVNGKTSDTDVLDTKVIEEAQNEIIVKGTKEVETVTTSTASSSSSSASVSSVGTSTGEAVASYALQFVGNPYVYGGSSLTDGADCSGFTMAVFAEFGVSLPHYADEQAYYGYSVGTDISNAAAGDIVCYGYHVGIALGDGVNIVHASTAESGIKISAANDVGTIIDIRRLV